MKLVIRTIDLPKDTFRRKTVAVIDINEAYDVALEYVSQWREGTASLTSFNLYENDDNVVIAIVVVND
jgi:hypothetical protein